MNKIKIAKQLIRLAKSLIAYQPDDTVKTKSIVQIDDLKNIKDFSVLTEDNLVEIANIFYPMIIYKLKTYYSNVDIDQAKDIQQEFFITINKLYKQGKFNETSKGANANTYFNKVLHFTILSYMQKNHKTLFFKRNKLNRKFLNVNDLQNYIDKNTIDRPGFKIQKEQLEQQLNNKIFETFEKIKKKKLDDFQALYLFYFKDWKQAQIGPFLGKGEKFSSQAIRRWKQFIHDELKEQYEAYIEGPLDGLKLSSDFVEDILSSKEIWKKYIEKYGEPIQV